mmetsp:Transcript_90753/g.252438  ORF Transcript_90753/g.252438 Transcript_90753/m.252438 type:complete len:229 (-) Transcript_90753:232-918(-)
MFMAIGHGHEELPYQAGNERLAQRTSFPLQEVGARAAADVLQNKNELVPFLVLGILVNLDNVWVVELRQDADLLLHQLQGRGLHAKRVDHLAHTLLPSGAFAHQVHSAEGALAQLADRLVVPREEEAVRVPVHQRVPPAKGRGRPRAGRWHARRGVHKTRGRPRTGRRRGGRRAHALRCWGRGRHGARGRPRAGWRRGGRRVHPLRCRGRRRHGARGRPRTAWRRYGC